MEGKLIRRTEKFVKQAFVKNPHFSYGDWSVMYNHSVTAKDIALEIAAGVECDKTLVALGALLHDIGKTHVADWKTLHLDHEKSICQFRNILSERSTCPMTRSIS